MKPNHLVCNLIVLLIALNAGPVSPAEPSVGKTEAQPPRDASATRNGETLAQLTALKDNDPKIRRQAADALGRLGDKAAIEPLVGTLRDPDRNVRWSAARALGMLGDRRAVDPLIAALKDQDTWVRGGVAEALGQLGDKRAVEPLRAVLKREDGSVDEAVACALAVLVKDETAVEPLLAAIEHPASEWTGLAVFTALMQIGPPAVKPLAAALPRAGENKRKNIVLALTHLGDEAAVDPLIKALDDPNGDVARVAACGLAQLDAPRAVAPLATAIKDRHSALWREESTSADFLADRLHLPATGIPADLTPLVSAMEDPRWQLRYSAAWVLGRRGDKRAAAALTTVLRSAERAPTLEGVWLCGQALARLQSPLGIAPLVRVLKEHDDFDGRENEPGAPGVDWRRRTREKRTAQVIEAFAAIGPAAVAPLMALLKDASPAVRAVSAQALGQLGDKQAIDALKAASNDPESRVRESAAEAIRAIHRTNP